MKCPKCNWSYDTKLVIVEKNREHWFCYKCRKGFYVFLKKKRRIKRTKYPIIVGGHLLEGNETIASVLNKI